MAMLLNWMILLPVLGALTCFFARSASLARQIALATSIATLAVSIIVAFGYDYSNGGVQMEYAMDWISAIGVSYRVGIDGLSLPLILLTTSLSVLVVLAAWSIDKAVPAFMGLYLLLLAGMLGVFLALDLFLFYVFFEISLLPMYFLIGVWGGPRKEYAAIKFFLYTLVGSICLLIAMLGLYFITSQANDGQPVWTLTSSTDVMTLISPEVSALFASPSGELAGGEYWGFAQIAFWLTLVAFMVKLPAVPFHTWLPDAHVEAPTPISMVLAGVLLKMGGYAMMRITYPIFPDAALHFWLCVATLGVVAILYGAFCAMAQTDWKKLVAYSSVSHMGYVTLGIAVLTPAGFNGAYFQMIAHGITSAMMFFLVGVVYERAHHRDLNRFGGLWLKFPSYGGWSLVGFFAGMGLPGLCGFIGEVLVLLGTFQAAGNEALIGRAGVPDAETATIAAYVLGALAASGVVLTAGYILWMFQRVYMGQPRKEYDTYEKPNPREYGIMVVLGLAAVLFGVAPMLIFDITTPTLKQLLTLISGS